jgi:hypothetical protein
MIEGIRKIAYEPSRRSAHPHYVVRDFEAAAENGVAVFRVCEALKR